MDLDIILNRLINGVYCLPCFALIVLLVSAAKIHFKEQALEAGTKQSIQAVKAGRLKSQTGMPALFWADLFCFVPAFSACSS